MTERTLKVLYFKKVGEKKFSPYKFGIGKVRSREDAEIISPYKEKHHFPRYAEIAAQYGNIFKLVPVKLSELGRNYQIPMFLK